MAALRSRTSVVPPTLPPWAVGCRAPELDYDTTIASAKSVCRGSPPISAGREVSSSSLFYAPRSSRLLRNWLLVILPNPFVAAAEGVSQRRPGRTSRAYESNLCPYCPHGPPSHIMTRSKFRRSTDSHRIGERWGHSAAANTYQAAACADRTAAGPSWSRPAGARRGGVSRRPQW